MGAAAALAVFGGAYSSSLAPLQRAWGQAAARGVAASGVGGATGSAKKITSFVQFWSDMAPSLLLHGQALAVAVVSAGFSKGAVDGYMAEHESEAATPEKQSPQQ